MCLLWGFEIERRAGAPHLAEVTWGAFRVGSKDSEWEKDVQNRKKNPI